MPAVSDGAPQLVLKHGMCCRCLLTPQWIRTVAEGVTNASAVVCFMSHKYQESENCRLELQFAKQTGIGIIPVMMEGGGWRASGWLGIVTAGCLWTRLSDDTDFDAAVRQLYGQIQSTIGDGVIVEGDELADSETSTSEAKEELERLRDDLVRPDANMANKIVLADPSQPATLPAGALLIYEYHMTCRRCINVLPLRCLRLFRRA